jgi:hypothetical protein
MLRCERLEGDSSIARRYPEARSPHYDGSYSGLMPTDFTTFAHFSVSERK